MHVKEFYFMVTHLIILRCRARLASCTCRRAVSIWCMIFSMRRTSSGTLTTCAPSTRSVGEWFGCSMWGISFCACCVRVSFSVCLSVNLCVRACVCRFVFLLNNIFDDSDVSWDLDHPHDISTLASLLSFECGAKRHIVMGSVFLLVDRHFCK
jgi:hypothetical protein